MKRLGYYSDDTPDLAKRILLLGANMTELANALDVSMHTLRQWEQKYPKFAEAIQIGMQATSRVAEALYKRAVGYDYEEDRVIKKGEDFEVVRLQRHMPPDTKAALAYLYNRDPERWRDRQLLTDGNNELLKGLRLVFVDEKPKMIDVTPTEGHAD